MKIETDKNGKAIFWTVGDLNFGYQEIDKSRLLEEGYFMNAYVYMIVNRIAEKVATLPYKFCDEEGNEIKNKEIDDFIYLLNQSGGKKVFIEKVTANLLALGEFFVIMQKPIGFNQVSKLDVISPVNVELRSRTGQDWDNDIIKFDISNYYSGYREVLPENMIFGKYPNIRPTTNRGLSPFEPLWDVVQASNNAFKAHGQLIRNMGANGIISPKSNAVESRPLQSEERGFLQKALDAMMGSFVKGSRHASNFGKTIISQTGVDYTQIGFDPAKLQILDMNKENLKVLASACNLDSNLFNDADGSKYNNRQEAIKTAYLDCYLPTANYVLRVLSDALLPDDINWQIDLDRIDILNQRDQAREKETREGIISIQNQIADNKILVESGVLMLQMIYGYSEDDARALLIVPQQNIQQDERL